MMTCAVTAPWQICYTKWFTDHR